MAATAPLPYYTGASAAPGAGPGVPAAAYGATNGLNGRSGMFAGVPTAWGEEDSSVLRHSGGGAAAAAAQQAAAAAASAAQQAAAVAASGVAPPYTGGYPQEPSHQQYQPGYSMPMQQPYVRGPATNIRDSLTCAPGRQANRGPGSRQSSRDPSPKGRQESPAVRTGRRGDSPAQRGDSPMRMSGRVARGSSPSAHTGPVRSAPSSVGSIGFCIGSRTAPVSGAPPGSGPGMRAFRSGGPVRAKADMLADSSGTKPVRARPATAPPARGTAQPRSGSNSRPPSPGASVQRSGSNSRPASPVERRAPSPKTHAEKVGGQPPPSYAYAQPSASAVPRQRSAPSSHMRRAPSPTPAFNRPPSPSKPRWRT